MIMGFLLILLGVLLVVVAYRGLDTVNKSRQEFMAEWDKMRGKPPEHTAKRYSGPNYVPALMGATLILMGILSLLSSFIGE